MVDEKLVLHVGKVTGVTITWNHDIYVRRLQGISWKPIHPKQNPPFLFGSNQSCFVPGLDCEVLERTVGETLFFAFEEAGFQDLKSLGRWVKSPIRWLSQCQAVSGVRWSTIDYQQIGPKKSTNKKNAFYGRVVMLTLLLLLHDLGSRVGAAWGEWSGVAMVWPWRGWETQGGLVGHFSFVWCLQVGHVKLNGFDMISSCTRKIKNPGIYEEFHGCSCTVYLWFFNNIQDWWYCCWHIVVHMYLSRVLVDWAGGAAWGATSSSNWTPKKTVRSGGGRGGREALLSHV